MKVRKGGGEEIPLVQGKEQWLRIAGADMKRSINVIHYINRMKDRNCMSLSIDTVKVFDKFQHFLSFLFYCFFIEL